MCGRYFLPEEGEDEELDEIIRILSESYHGEEPLAARGEIFPGQTVPTLANSRAGIPGPYAMHWGMALPGERRGAVINARLETAGQRPLFRESWRGRRCLIPAGRYFEWESQDNRKIKYAIGPGGGGLLYLAGLYRYEEGLRYPRFVIVTRQAAEPLAFIHHRMPVIFDRAGGEAWLRAEGDPDRLLALSREDMIAQAQ